MQENARWVGRTLRDKWHIDARIARGGVGTVFAATHRNNGSRAAIKVLHAEFARDEDTKSRFLQEGYAANQVNHPGVVRILDDDIAEDGSAYLVMELLEGELLERRRVARGGRLPMAEVYEIADQLLDVIAAAHEKGIVHRDIKPDNLFLTKEGRLKVLDFGFAQMKSGFRKEQTATGYLLGTPGFMSPEQALGARGQVDAMTDIWAVGATMFTLLSGHPVHEAESAAEMLVAAANFPARSLAQVAPEVPMRLVEIVDRALAFDKTDRWPSARSMQNALRGVPGRQALGGAGWDSGRRSVPDPAETTRDFNEATQISSESIEVLDSEELKAVSWQTGDRTVMAQTAPMPEDAIPSDLRRPAKRHPADSEHPTVAKPSPVDDAPPMTPHAADGGTLIMDANAAFAAQQPPMGPNGPNTLPLGANVQPYGVQASAPPAQPFGADLRASRADDMMYVAGPARTAPAPQKASGRSVLAFIGVAIVSMVIVVVTGLIILAASEP